MIGPRLGCAFPQSSPRSHCDLLRKVVIPLPIMRIAWYAHPTLTKASTYCVAPALGAQCVAIPPDWSHHPDVWLEQARPHFQDAVLEAIPIPGDLLAIGPHAYQWDGDGWTAVPMEHLYGTSLTAGRPLAYGISPLAPRGPYTLADHQAIAQQFARWIWAQGLFPVLPHLYFPHFLDDSVDTERTLALHVGQCWLLQSSVVLQLDVPCSSGMAAERQWAERYHRSIEVVPWEALDLADPYRLAGDFSGSSPQDVLA